MGSGHCKVLNLAVECSPVQPCQGPGLSQGDRKPLNVAMLRWRWLCQNRQARIVAVEGP